jgi:hypothetical protein
MALEPLVTFPLVTIIGSAESVAFLMNCQLWSLVMTSVQVA